MALALAVMGAGVSCTGGQQDDGVTGVAAVPVLPAGAGRGEISASAQSKVLVCHKGADKWVPAGAITDHLGHGDTLGSCSGTDACPCFSAPYIQVVAAECETVVTATCSTGEPYYLVLECDPGGSQAPWLLGFYVSRESDGYCQRDDVLAGPFDQANVDHAACVAAINASGYCQ